MTFPHWLIALSWTSLAAACACVLVVLIDQLRGHRERMWIMNVVWPLTMLYAGPVGLWFYWRRRGALRHSKQHHGAHWQTVAVGTTHCGSGCTLADVIVEGFVTILFPLSLFGQRVFGAWLLDLVAAFLFGIAFQYFSIKPMRNLSAGRGLIEAIKADALSLSAWQLGMYAWMAVALFAIFSPALPKSSPVFWFMMQLAMMVGFAASYPVNRWLIARGIKEAM